MSDGQPIEESANSERDRLWSEMAAFAEAVDQRPLTFDELRRMKEIKALAHEVGCLALIEVYADSIEDTHKGYRRRAEKDRACDSEIAAAAGLMHNEDEQEYVTPVEGLPDTRPPAPQVEDVFNPSATIDRTLETGDVIFQAIRELQAARAHGFDLAVPAKCGRLFAVMAHLTAHALQDAADRLAPPAISPPPGVFEAAEWQQLFARTWGDAFAGDDDQQRTEAYRIYCERRAQYGLRAVGIRQYQRDLEDGLNTIRNYRRTGKAPKRGRKN